MPTPKFTHLHAHSHYSLLDGMGKVPDIVQATKNRGMDSIAITDHGNMYGAVEFFQAATEAGIKPIFGEEMYLARDSHLLKRGRIDANPFHLILLAKNETGFKNLIQLTTKAHLEGFYYKPRIDKELLKQYGEGLIALSGCLGGIVSDAILRRTEAEAKQEILELQEIFGEGNFFLEMQYHPNEKDQVTVNNALMRFSKELGVKPVATADFHYIDQKDADIHDILLCIQTSRNVDEKDRMDLRGYDLSMKTPEQMVQEFSNVPEAIASTQEIADQCNVTLKLGQTLLPVYEVPATKTPESYLRELCMKGIGYRYGLPEPVGGNFPEGTTKEISDRLEYELSVINQTGFASYFLIVQDFVNYAKDAGIQVGPGRGSAAGSLVSYLLKITNLDPLKYDLLFERFLNPERISMPDIDLDFADDRRDEVLRYVEKKYGRDHVAQIITFGTMAARMAVRDVARALGLPYAYPDKIAKLIPMFKSLTEAVAEVPELKAMYDNEIDAKRIIDAAMKLEGVARHASVHACGVVISKEVLTEYLPLQLGEKNADTIVTQFSLHPVEDIGLLKMDFLGLKNLTIIQNAINLIRTKKGVDIDMDKLPLDDQKAYKLFQDGKTTGVFQFESQGMKRYLMQLKPTQIEDLIAMVALYRPGPMELIPSFIDRKFGREKVTYLHPKLEAVLKNTYGVGVYQEQMMQIARSLAGFSLAEADTLRKAIGKKNEKLLNEQKAKLIDGMVANGIDKHTAQGVWEMFPPFARYGFNRSHAACYAIVAYQTAYLKANFPAEFMAALLTSDKHDTDRIAIEVEETRQMGVPVLPPDVNSSDTNFSVVQEPDEEGTLKESIRFGLTAIKNVGEHVVFEICAEREKNGKFTDLSDFVARIQTKDLNKKSLESLAKAGALDALEERQTVLDNMETILDFGKRVREKKLAGQRDIFGALSGGAEMKPTITLKKSPQAAKQQRLNWEKELLGLYVSEHPMSEYAEFLRGKIESIRDVIKGITDEGVVICGIITKIQKVFTRKQQNMVFATVEDTTSSVEVLVFPKILDETQELWVEGNVVIIEGTRSAKDGIPKILANSIRRFSEDYLKRMKPKEKKQVTPQSMNMPGFVPTNIQINLTQTSAPTNLQALKDFLNIRAQAKSGAPIYLAIANGGTQLKKIETKYKLDYSPEVIDELEKIVGEGMVKAE